MQTRRQGAKAPMKKTCQLDDTPDEDARSYDGDKENEVNAVKPGRKSKRKDGARAGHGGKKGLSKRQKVTSQLGIRRARNRRRFSSSRRRKRRSARGSSSNLKSNWTKMIRTRSASRTWLPISRTWTIKSLRRLEAL
ncbi:hypothetical protein GQ600_22427 [Phytophthora cactorum]|nr:hypothetical protein GQ600_22427 [Phytophthora cactorum]